MIAKTYFLRSLYFLAFLLINVACKDEQTGSEPKPVPVPLQNERLLLKSSLRRVDSVEYNLDKTPKRLAIDGPGNLVTISYESNKVTHEIRKFGKVFAKRVYELENGIAQKSTFLSVDNDGKEIVLAAKTYFYKAGKLVRETYTAADPAVKGFYIDYLYDSSNENVSVKEVRDNAGSLLEKTTFEYSEILDKSGFINQWTTDMDGTLFPQKSKFLKNREVVEFNNSVATSTFTYELDEQGYVIKGKRVNDMGTEKETLWTNTWQ